MKDSDWRNIQRLSWILIKILAFLRKLTYICVRYSNCLIASLKRRRSDQPFVENGGLLVVPGKGKVAHL